MAFLDDLRVAVADKRDIEAIIQSAAGGHSTIGLGGIVTFYTGNPNKVVFARAKVEAGEITSLEPGEALASDEARRALIERAKIDSSDTHGFLIVHRVLFSRIRIERAFRWTERVQLRPCCSNLVIDELQTWLPDLNLGAHSRRRDGPPFPLILEVRIPRSPNSLIEANRTIRLLDYWQHVLAVFVTGDIGYSSPSSERVWTCRHEDGNHRNRLVEPGLLDGEASGESNLTAAQQVELEQSDEYYDRLWASDTAMRFPTSLPKDLSLQDDLSADERAAFARAAYWSTVGIRARNQEPVAITAYAAAIECLLPRPKLTRCTCCGQESGRRPTYFFTQHLKRYAKPSGRIIQKMQSELYSVRSKLVHGMHVPDVDVDFLSASKDHTSSFLLEWFARKSLVNWVRAPDRSTWHLALGENDTVAAAEVGL